MNAQDFSDMIQLCQKLGIKTFGELEEFKAKHNIKTSQELLAKLKKIKRCI